MRFSSGAGPTGMLSFVLLAAAFTPACGERAKPQAAEPEKPKVVRSQFPNDTALFLAGMKGRADGPYHALESAPAWQKYAAGFDETWNNIAVPQFQKVDEFERRELEPVKTKADYLFYPLSGPDVLYAVHFFPDAKTMVFAGLEPVGNLKPAADYRDEKLEKELTGWRSGVASIFGRTFFVTSEMDRAYRGAVSDGLLSTILLLMARSGHTVDGVDYMQVSADGKLSPEDPATDPKKHQLAKIDFHRGNETVQRTLYYFSRDFSKDFEPAIPPFLNSLGKPDTLVKSGSFLLHWKQMEQLRGYILDHSLLLLQDDTGVPYRYLTPPTWEVRLFGEYSHPDRPFTSQWQKDLAAAFANPANVRQLGFPEGYGSKRRPSSMMLAIRKQ